MGHNKGWEEAASMLSGASIELKTCNAALLEATGKTWEEVRGPTCCLYIMLSLDTFSVHWHFCILNDLDICNC